MASASACNPNLDLKAYDHPSSSKALEEETKHRDSNIIDEVLLASDADLLYAKMQLEERLKSVLKYDFSYVSPLQFVHRFFANTFAEGQRNKGPVKEWLTVTERYINNTLVLPMTQSFQPVYVAAAYLALTKQNLHLAKAQKEALSQGKNAQALT